MKPTKFLPLVLVLFLLGCSLTTPIAATEADLTTCPKKGEASCSVILGVILSGDASVNAAARAGGITHVCTVDVKRTAILGVFYVKETTQVTGR